MSIKIAVLPVTPFQQNCSIVWCETTMQAAIVDPGGDADRIADAVEQLNVKVEKVLLTHGHIDHAAAATEIAEKYGVEIEGPGEADAPFLESLPEQGEKWGMPARPAKPARWLAQDDVVTVGELEFEVRHCPGHTPGHVIYLYRPEKVAIVGDVVFQGSIGRTDLPMGDHDQLLRSIKEQVLTLEDDWGFLPGHGPASSVGRERASNPFLRGL